jgi:hypothetical protein
MTKNLSLIVLTCTLFFACSKDEMQDELATCEEFLFGSSGNCSGNSQSQTCTYIVRIGKTEDKQRSVEVDKKTYDYYSAKFDEEDNVCYIGMIQ